MGVFTVIAVTATETKNHFGKVLRQTAKGPVTIEKSGSPVAVLVSYDTFERYQALEDYYWGEMAKAARGKGGYLEGEILLEKINRRIDES